MQTPQHDLRAFQTPVAAPRRFISVGLVALLHVVIIYALASGLAAQMIQKLPDELKAEVVQEKPPAQEKLPPPPPPDLTKPPPPFVPPPDITVADTGPSNAITSVQTHQAPVVAPQVSAPVAVGRKHECMSGYPPVSRRLGEEGSVLVKYVITETGEVSNPSVQKSSGYARLDEAATQCVKDWRFKPATQGGRAIATSSQANVIYKFTN
ncbi:MAG TPA: TonB family protein [Rhizomicrobium sp.]|nr:TonB family protein [Rhizomicrobium sp.]